MEVAFTALISALADIIRAASTSELAIFALIISLVFFLTRRFFHTDHPALRTFIFIVVLGSAAWIVRETIVLRERTAVSESIASDALELARNANMAADAAKQAAEAANTAANDAAAAASAAAAANGAAEAAMAAEASTSELFDKVFKAANDAMLEPSLETNSGQFEQDAKLLGSSIGNIFIDSRSISSGCLEPNQILDIEQDYNQGYRGYRISFENSCKEPIRISYWIKSCHEPRRMIGTWIERASGGEFELRRLKGTYFTYSTERLYAEPALMFYAQGASTPSEFIVAFRVIPRDRSVGANDYPLVPACELLPY